MTVTELAYVKLLGGLRVGDEELTPILRAIKADIEDFNKLTTNFFVALNDPTVFYVIGSWQTKDQHAKTFVGTPRQANVMKMGAGKMDVVWMNYVDVEYNQIPTTAATLAITRYRVTDEGLTKTAPGRAKFEQEWPKDQSAPSVGGWRLPRKDGEWEGDTWVSFVGADPGPIEQGAAPVSVIDSAKAKLVDLS